LREDTRPETTRRSLLLRDDGDALLPARAARGGCTRPRGTARRTQGADTVAQRVDSAVRATATEALDGDARRQKRMTGERSVLAGERAGASDEGKLLTHTRVSMTERRVGRHPPTVLSTLLCRSASPLCGAALETCRNSYGRSYGRSAPATVRARLPSPDIHDHQRPVRIAARTVAALPQAEYLDVFRSERAEGLAGGFRRGLAQLFGEEACAALR
jgi:hypothetical protein